MKITHFLAIFFAISTFNAQAFEVVDGFFLQPSLTVEYSAPHMSDGGVNGSFKTNIFEKQLKNFENIAVGVHFRVHKYVGINANWAQTDLDNGALQNYSVALKPRFKMDQFNVSALFFAPIVEDSLFELFAETGVSDMNSKLVFFESSGTYNYQKTHETHAFIGAGFQLAPFEDSTDAFRMSVQRYIGKLALLDTNYTTIRIGYVKSF
ncbi:MAG TPA: hypothetical protein VI861_02005 [Rickettsiales bacterium]|nr:hypothetical protein [Rickettsiales bacterium]